MDTGLIHLVCRPRDARGRHPTCSEEILGHGLATTELFYGGEIESDYNELNQENEGFPIGRPSLFILLISSNVQNSHPPTFPLRCAESLRSL